MSDTPQKIKSKIYIELEESLADDKALASSIKKIGRTIQDIGVSVEDACLMTDLDFDLLEHKMKELPIIGRYFNIKRIQYKNSLLNILHNHARNANDHKLALQLLSLGFSDEYDASVKKEKAKHSREDSQDTLQKLMNRIRKQAPNSPVDEKLNINEKQKESDKEIHELSHLINHG